MNLDIDTLRHTWRETAPRVRFRPYPEVDDEGLHYGAATRLAPRGLKPGGPEEARAYALLSIVAGRPARLDSLRFLHRALAQWEKGEKALAQFELAFAQFPRLTTRDDTWPLFWADALINDGIAPEALLHKLGFVENFAELARSVDDEPRVPPGHGRQSGEWTTGGSAGGQQHQATKTPVQKYEVGLNHELQRKSVIGDNLAVHHVMQKHAAKQIIPGYDSATAPGIAVPELEHHNIRWHRGTYEGTARDLLAHDIYNLRTRTAAPRPALQKLIELNKAMYPEAFSK